MGDRLVWGKIIGGVAGFAMGGPIGAIAGVVLGHAADSGGAARIGTALGRTQDHRLRADRTRPPRRVRVRRYRGTRGCALRRAT